MKRGPRWTPVDPAGVPSLAPIHQIEELVPIQDIHARLNLRIPALQPQVELSKSGAACQCPTN